MKKLFSILFSAIIIFLLSGCTTTKSYTFKVTTNDNIKITLRTNNGYDISSDVPFELKKNKEIISYGFFITIESYNEYQDLINNNDKVELIENNSNDDIDYLFYKYDTDIPEYNYVIKIKNSNTGMIIANNISLDSAKDMFEHLSFKKI